MKIYISLRKIFILQLSFNAGGKENYFKSYAKQGHQEFCRPDIWFSLVSFCHFPLNASDR
jgi:hypothetical protein